MERVKSCDFTDDLVSVGAVRFSDARSEVCIAALCILTSWSSLHLHLQPSSHAKFNLALPQTTTNNIHPITNIPPDKHHNPVYPRFSIKHPKLLSQAWAPSPLCHSGKSTSLRHSARQPVLPSSKNSTPKISASSPLPTRHTMSSPGPKCSISFGRTGWICSSGLRLN